MANVRGLSDYSGGGGGGRRPGGAGSSGNVRGLGDYSGGPAEDSDDDVNELYTGGEKSGMVVKGPPKKRGDHGQVDRLFDSAREHGAVQGGAEDLARARGSDSEGRQVFSGTVRTLDGRNEPAPEQPQAAPSQVTHTITFYRNNIFTVDDGPGRGIGAPENMEFMQSIMQGVHPVELQPEHAETEVEVNLVKRDEDYQPPLEPTFQSFKGTGRKLTADEGNGAAAAAAEEAPPGEWHGIDVSQPATSLQLRMADGGRMVTLPPQFLACIPSQLLTPPHLSVHKYRLRFPQTPFPSIA